MTIVAGSSLSPSTPLVALVEDDADLRASISQMLALAGYRVRAFVDAASALDDLDDRFEGVVVSDVRMPGMSGIELFRRLHARDADLPVLLITGHGDVPMAVDALKAGAWDFITKPFVPDDLLAAIGRGIAHRALALDNRRLRALAQTADTSPLVGRSPAIQRLRDMIGTLADADIDVLIEGETGTGKELLARLIHRGGKRARHRFAAVACAALTDEDAAAGADLLTDDQIAAADKGTLFLDDVDRAPAALQARLASLAEERAVHRVVPIPIDLRIVSTAGEQADARIDPALFYRLAGVRLRVPPLRERLEDVPMLFAHLLDVAASRLRRPLPALTAAVRQQLVEHRWPGNVRELAHFADRVMIGLEPAEQDGVASADALPDRVALFERQAIVDAVIAAKGDAGVAMQALGLPRKTFYYKVQRHGIDLTGLRRQGAERN